MKNFSRLDKDIKLTDVAVIGTAAIYPIPAESEFEANIMKNDTGFDEYDLEAQIQDLLEAGNAYTKCNCCNRRIRYCVIVQNTTNGLFHLLGANCAEIYSLSDRVKSSLDKIQKKSATVKKRMLNAKKVSEFVAQYEGLEDALKVNNRIIQDMREKLLKYFKLSDKQIAFIFRLAEQQKKWNEQRETSNVPPIKTGEKIDSEQCEIITIKEKVICDDYIEIKMLIERPNGQRLYGNAPKNLIDAKKGDKIIFSARKITASKNDKTFGFYSYPKGKRK